MIANLFIANIHHTHDYHSSKENESKECQICNLVKSRNDFYADFQTDSIENNKVQYFYVNNTSDKIEFITNSFSLSRAPPLS